MKYISLFFSISLILWMSGCANPKPAMARQQLRDSQTPFSQKAFTQSIVEGDNNKVDLFLTGGMDTKIGQHNSNPLIVAVQSNHPEIVEILLNNGAEIDPPGFPGSPLCIAAAKGYTNIAELLIARKADINFLKGNLNPMILAADAGHKDMVQLLLNSKADYDVQGESTLLTPLMMAARQGHAEIVKLLLEKGADTQLVDHGGKTALTHAVFAEKTDTAELIIADKNYNPDEYSTQALTMAIAMNKIPIARKIIERGTNINAQIGSLNLLSWAIKNKYEAGAELLINSGAEINKPDKENMIPLDYAFAAKNDKIVRMLRSAKVETNEVKP